MNNNAIVSLAMLYALWESKQQDLLGVIRPFVLYAVGEKTIVGSRIEISDICERELSSQVQQNRKMNFSRGFIPEDLPGSVIQLIFYTLDSLLRNIR